MPQQSPRVLVVYESLFGATRHIAEAIADGLRRAGGVAECRSVREVSASELDAYDLVVVGSPTHGRTMPTAASRAEGERWLEHRMRGRILEPRATEAGVREWIGAASFGGRRVAVFATRADLPRLLTGSAAAAIGRAVRRQRGALSAPGLEALVDDRGSLLPGETDRASRWGAKLATSAREGAGTRG